MSKTKAGYGAGSPQTTIRFTREQFDAVKGLLRDFPANVHTFADGLRAAIVRPPWLPKNRMTEIIAVFRN